MRDGESVCVYESERVRLREIEGERKRDHSFVQETEKERERVVVHLLYVYQF